MDDYDHNYDEEDYTTDEYWHDPSWRPIDPFNFEPQEEYSVTVNCVKPTLLDAVLNFLGPVLIANIALNILCHSIKSPFAIKLITSSIGLLLNFYNFPHDYLLFVFHLVYLIALSTTTQLARRKHIIWSVVIIAICINETFIIFRTNLIRLRPHIMIMVMKTISFHQFKLEAKEKQDEESTDFLAALAYLTHPLSTLLGVWHPLKPTDQQTQTKLNVIKTFYYLFISLICLLLSTCLIHYYISEKFLLILCRYLFMFLPKSTVHFIGTSLNVYLTALQFRASHYFICFAAQSMLIFWRFPSKVAIPLSVEFPRSLVDVVVAWNIPLHNWLKPYVFAPAKKSFGAFPSILITYFISSFLHGFNFQIWSVLLSLGILTKIEYDLRLKLSRIFDACIEARKCQYQEVNQPDVIGAEMICQSKRKHKNTPHNCWWVKMINIFFSLLAIVHLAYLGSTFDGKEESSYLRNVLSVWSNLNFYSHGIALLTFVFYKIICI